MVDELNRPREIATFQIDIGNARRFGIKYVNEKNERVYPPIIHTAMIGTIERYLFTVFDTAALKAKAGGVPELPVWLSPVQVRLIPVSSEYLGDADKIADKIEGEGFRVDVDDRALSVSRRVRDAELKWVPYIVVVGEKEAKTGVLTVRVRSRREEVEMKLEELLKELREAVKGYPRRPLTLPRHLSKRPVYT